MAKENGHRQWRRPRQTLAPPPSHDQRLLLLHSPRAVPGPPVLDPRHQSTCRAIRAPPYSLTNSNPQHSLGISIEVESPLRSRGKRSVPDAFSPTSAAFDHERPPKRLIGRAVEILQSTVAGVTHRRLSSRCSFSQSCSLAFFLCLLGSRCCGVRTAHSASDLNCLVLIGPSQTEAGSEGVHCTDLVICPRMSTERRRSTSSSIPWRVPP
jgi:hypothetical protein